MVAFWLCAFVLVVLAVLFVALPLRHYQRNPVVGDGCDQEAVNLQILRGQLDDLDQRYQNGVLTRGEYSSLRAELERRLLTEVGEATEPTGRSNLLVPSVLAACIPVLAFALYSQLGGGDQLRHQAAIRALSTITDPAQGLEALRDVVATWPNDSISRYMLAGVFMGQGEYRAAADQFAIVVDNTGGRQSDPVIQQALALYLGADRKVDAHIEALIDQAMALDPNNSTGLELAGIAAFERQRYPEAVKFWTRLLAQTTDPTIKTSLQSGIDRARAAMGELSTNRGEVALAESRISVLVSLDKSLEDIPDSAKVLVYARTADAPMPIAIVPMTAGQLPCEITLDDSRVMIKGASLAEHKQVDVVARLSLTGDVMHPDFESHIRNIKVGSGMTSKLVISADGA